MRFIIVILLTLAKLSHSETTYLYCGTIKCRYDQHIENVHSEINVADTGNSKSINEQNYLSTYAVVKPPRFSKTDFCISYISSYVMSQTDFDKMLDCTIIDLSGNRIEKIESQYFENLHLLQSLILDNNQLKMFPAHVFYNLVNLRRITVRYNLLEVLEGDLFLMNEILEHIDLSNNKIIKVSPNIIDNLPHLRFISFNGNICVDSNYPEISKDDLKAMLTSNCGEKNLFTFIVGLMKISSKLQGQFCNSSELKDNGTNHNSNHSQSENDYILTSPNDETKKNDNDLDTLMIGLFWLIIPIIFILFIILALISYAIYKKYFVYSLNASRRA
ncbi:CLUMA_CG018467, isoform A [Clunio marinus]|uniref:CLUMA_CG018467, isoform A n=1 Tax=Clunio marinus TaxID=568069 RepID=A0A1J1IXP4_9DIPT|nr:CLUMA_CG018467, isoform A [Clunio marinus]